MVVLAYVLSTIHEFADPAAGSMARVPSNCTDGAMARLFDLGSTGSMALVLSVRTIGSLARLHPVNTTGDKKSYERGRTN